MENSLMTEYTKLHKQYYNDYKNSYEEYMEKHSLYNKSSYLSKDYPDLDRFREELNKKISELNAPLLARADFKVGDSLQFVYRKDIEPGCDHSEDGVRLDKLNQYIVVSLSTPAEPKEERRYYKNIIVTGIVTEIGICGGGTGEVVYVFSSELDPPVSNENRPSCPEQRIIRKL